MLKPHEFLLLLLVACLVLWQGVLAAKDLYLRYKAGAPARARERERQQRLEARIKRIQQNHQLQEHKRR